MTEDSNDAPMPLDPGTAIDVIETANTPDARPQDAISSFTTSQGSVYRYDEDGRTTRFKTKTGIEQPKQDLTVFVEAGFKDAKTVLAAFLLRSSTEKTKIEVVQQQPDGTMQIVTNIQDVTNPDELQVVSMRGDRIVKARHASLFPKIGLYVYDSRRFEENGVTRTERHLGHKVTDIKYKD